MAAEHKQACETVEHELQHLKDAYASLEKELDEKQEELDARAQQSNRDTNDEKLLQIQDLKDQLKQIENEKRDMQDQIDRLQRDTAQLIEKNVKTGKERGDERKTFQNVLHL